MSSQEIEQMSEFARKFYIEKNYEGTMKQLKEIENAVMTSCLNNSSLNLDQIFYENLKFIISEVAISYISLNLESLVDLTLIKNGFTCLRNSLYKNSENQYLIANDKSYTETMVTILNNLVVMDSQFLVNCNEEGHVKDKTKQIFNDTLSASISFFVNLVSGNSELRKIVWPVLQQHIMDVVHLSEPSVNHIGAALLHQFLIEDELKEDIFRRASAGKLLENLLTSYLQKGPHACFVLYCIEILMQSASIIPSTWSSLKPVESLLLLDILTSNIPNAKIPIPILLFFNEIFKKQSDYLLKLRDVSENMDPQVIIRAAGLICAAAASDHYRSTLQEDKSLLISSCYVIKRMTDIGSLNFESQFSRVADEAVTEKMKNHPIFGFKSDIIRLIASLVYRHRTNQDTVRELSGITMILENSQYDARNPLIRESCVFAIRNLLEGNEENQKVISDLQLKGPAENETLSRLGLEISVENGKLSLHQRDV